MQKKLILILLAVLVAAVFVFPSVLCLFPPRPVVEDTNHTAIAHIQYTFDGADNTVDLSGYPEEEILRRLHICMERPTAEKAGGYQLANTTLILLLRSDDGLKKVLLGDLNYSYGGVDFPKYDILNAGETLDTLFALLRSAGCLPDAAST